MFFSLKCNKITKIPKNNYNLFFSLPEEIIRQIYELCMDKKENMDRVLVQFIKGGFHRKNLRIHPFMERQPRTARGFWNSKRLNIESFGNTYDLLSEWCPKKSGKAQAAIYREKHIYNNGTSSTRTILSAAEPVSHWLNNIEKFEYTHPALATYLTKKRKIKVQITTAFYKKRCAKKLKKRMQHLKRENKNKRIEILLLQTKIRKLEEAKMYGFAVGQQITIPCSAQQLLGPQNPNYIWVNAPSGDYMYDGKICSISSFNKSRCYNKLCPDSVNAAWEVQVTVRSTDGVRWFSNYTPEVLTERVRQWNKF